MREVSHEESLRIESKRNVDGVGREYERLSAAGKDQKTAEKEYQAQPATAVQKGNPDDY